MTMTMNSDIMSQCCQIFSSPELKIKESGYNMGLQLTQLAIHLMF